MRTYRNSFVFQSPPEVPAFVGQKQYHITLDDFIDSLRDLTNEVGTYTSIFDNGVFAFLKQIHDAYGTCFNLSLFYDDTNSAGGGTGWTLAQMTEHYKQEFQDNSDWIKFSFHAWTIDTRYRHGYDENNVDPRWDYSRNAYDDYLALKSEVIRFAGEDCWAQHSGVLHVYDGRKAEMELLRQEGWKVFMGIPLYIDMREFYYLSLEQRNQVVTTGIWHDADIGVYIPLRQFSIEKVVGPLIVQFESITELLEQHDTPLPNYFEIETHETYLLSNTTSVKNGYTETAVWCGANGFTNKFPALDEFSLILGYNWRQNIFN